MKAAGAILLLSISFLTGISIHALLAPKPPDPPVVTRYILLAPDTIKIAPYTAQEAAVPSYGGSSILDPHVPQPCCHASQAAIEPEEKRYYDTESLIELFSSTPWPVHLWPSLIRLIACEATTPEGVDSRAIGDEELMPVTGPSHGLTQVNISAHPAYHRSYDLLDGRENLLAAWSIYVESGYSFSPWSCAP